MIGDRLRARYAELSPSERRAADYLLEHLDDLAVYSAADVARGSGVSKATVSRLFQRLGFSGARQLRDQLRVGPGAPVPGASADFTEHAEQESANLRRALASLGEGRLERVADTVATARRVVVVGFRTSHPVAMHLRQQLAQARPQVSLLPMAGQSLGEDLADLSSEDAAILVGLRRRPGSFGRVLGAVAATGARTVLIADASGRRHAAQADEWIECPVTSSQPFASYAAGMSVAGLIAGAVLSVSRSAERIDRIGSFYDALNEIES